MALVLKNEILFMQWWTREWDLTEKLECLLGCKLLPMADIQKPKCKSLILDAGPLLSLSPLRGLASTYYTTPQVLAELKDGRAREHLEKLGLLSGVKVVVKSPDAASLTNGEFSRTDVRFVDLWVCVCVQWYNGQRRREIIPCFHMQIYV